MIPTKEQNPKGLHAKYFIQKYEGKEFVGYDHFAEPMFKPILKDVDSRATYFVLRLDGHCKDKKHLAACRKAILLYADEIKEHLPELSKDLIAKYGKP